MTPCFDDLLGRTATDAELQPPVADQVGGAGVLDHIKRILVPHVDNAGTNLEARCPRADGREEGERRRELLREVMHAVVRVVCTKFFRRNRQFYRLLQNIARGLRRRLARGAPMAK